MDSSLRLGTLLNLAREREGGGTKTDEICYSKEYGGCSSDVHTGFYIGAQRSFHQ